MLRFGGVFPSYFQQGSLHGAGSLFKVFEYAKIILRTNTASVIAPLLDKEKEGGKALYEETPAFV